MATQTKVHTEHRPPEAVQTAQKGAKSLQEFWTKFNNDWVMIFASSIPAIVHSILETTPLNPISGNAFIYGLAGILVAVLITWVLFEAIYLVVPNQHISFRNSWLGALVAAVGVQLYLVLFPFYVTHFLGSYTGTAGFAVILLFFFYYFAVILLLGAEINAFYAEGVHATPDNLVIMVHTMTSEQAIREEASVSHKNAEPKEILPKSEVDQLRAQPGTSAALEQPQSVHTNHRREKRSPSPSSSSRILTIVEVVVGTALAFLVQLLRLRRKK